MTRILYLGPVSWHSIRQRPQQLAARLAQHFSVTYVDPVGLRSMRLTDIGRAWQQATRTKETAGNKRNKLHSTMPLIRPRYIPLLGYPWLDQLNRRWLFEQVSAQFDFIGDDWILWLSTPSLLAEALVERASPRFMVYDCMDRYAAFHQPPARDRIDRAEAAIVSRADVVFASSPGLAERLEQIRQVTLVPNGVDFAHFAVHRHNKPEWKGQTSGPVIGYYGTIGDWLDYGLLIELAKQRPHWSFVFAGPVACRQFERLRHQPNVRYIGVVPYEQLPEHAAWFDVGLVPFRLNALTRYVYPIKALEYLALGLPVVSARLPDLADLAMVIQFASTTDEWLAALEMNLLASCRSAEIVSQRRQIAAAPDWNRRVAIIVERLAEPCASVEPQMMHSSLDDHRRKKRNEFRSTNLANAS